MSYTQGAVTNECSKDESALDLHVQGNQLLDLTQAMLSRANSDDWEEFELLEQQRRAMLEIVFCSQTVEAAKLQLVEVIKEILLIDQSICNIISQQRDLAAEELRHLKVARAGNKAYKMAADDSV